MKTLLIILFLFPQFSETKITLDLSGTKKIRRSHYINYKKMMGYYHSLPKSRQKIMNKFLFRYNVYR